MATNWPTSRDTFTNPSSGDTLDSPSHAAQHTNINDAVEAMQAHAGLVLVKPSSAVNGTVGANGAVTIGNAVSSVTVNDAFSSTFDNYRITLSSPVASASDSVISLRFGATTTGYYGSLNATAFNSTTPILLNRNNASDLYTTITDAGNAGTFMSFDVHSPYLAKRTGVMGTGYGYNYTAWFGGVLANTTSYTAFTLFPNTGTLTGGTIRVYGYNNG